MLVEELVAGLRALGAAANTDASVDRIIVGREVEEIRGIAVAWMPYRSVLEQAVGLDCNVVVTHEPVFYDHFDQDVDLERSPAVRAKRRLIEEHSLTVVRCHDTWDTLPEVGVLDSWSRILDLGPEVARSEFGRAFDVSGKTARAVARLVANRTKSLGQPAVQLLGDGDVGVTRAAIGTGAITPYFAFIRDLGADIAVCTDDGLEYWREGAYAIDNGVPIVVVNHGTAEEGGMSGLAAYLQTMVPDVPVHHLRQGCMYKLVID